MAEISKVFENARYPEDTLVKALSTVAAMQADTFLAVGDSVKTDGYTTAGDGGGANYLIAASQAVDGIKDYTLANGNVAINQIYVDTLTALGGFYPEPKAGDTIVRRAERHFFGSAVENAGTDNKLDGATFIGDPSLAVNSFYLDNAQTESISYYGGIGITSGSRSFDRYSYLGALGVWASGLSVTAGQKYGYSNKLYTADSTGTTGGTPPSHSSGSVSDGAISWTFVEHAAGTPIGSAAVVLQDVNDGRGAWARYTEAVRASTGGTAFGEEIVIKNKGSNVNNNPYNQLAGGSTIGQWFAGGGDASLGAPANPSTAAIVIGNNASTWNKGLVFGAEGITGTDGVTGSATAIAMAKGHRLDWFLSTGDVGASIKSDVDTASSAVSIEMTNNAVFFKGDAGEINGSFESTPSSVNYVRITPSATGDAVKVRAVGTDTDVDLYLETKGAGLVSFGSHTTIGAETTTGYITMKDASGVSRKIAVVS